MKSICSKRKLIASVAPTNNKARRLKPRPRVMDAPARAKAASSLPMQDIPVAHRPQLTDDISITSRTPKLVAQVNAIPSRTSAAMGTPSAPPQPLARLRPPARPANRPPRKPHGPYRHRATKCESRRVKPIFSPVPDVMSCRLAHTRTRDTPSSAGGTVKTRTHSGHRMAPHRRAPAPNPGELDPRLLLVAPAP